MPRIRNPWWFAQGLLFLAAGGLSPMFGVKTATGTILLALGAGSLMVSLRVSGVTVGSADTQPPREPHEIRIPLRAYRLLSALGFGAFAGAHFAWGDDPTLGYLWLIPAALSLVLAVLPDAGFRAAGRVAARLTPSKNPEDYR